MSIGTKLNPIVVVDDEPHITEVIRLYLEHANYEAVIIHNCEETMSYLSGSLSPSLLILDVMLPDGSGFELISRIRSMEGPTGQVPIIFLTAKGEPMDKLRGFNLGVDDYIVKPFDPNELIARIKAVLRRASNAGGGRSSDDPREASGSSKPRVLDIGELSIDLQRYKVTIEGQRIDLTPKEIELLYFLATNPNRVYTREDLLLHVWKFDFSGGTRTVDAHVKNLRKKLGLHRGWSIETLWGVGYSFEVKAHG
ncbi:response regulator transcription factor [Paenibacillus koleovorans]|uniref:response regulator transcription factor n=1 Tax=Paenibacillus koleovorans TaxID=121608 RepID=UPI000FD880D3|nr:response regulator transcription factor [Paenibacillus koleovorans]